MSDKQTPNVLSPAEAPRRKAKMSLKGVFRFLRDYRKTLSREGGLLPFATAAVLMGVSKQRVNELIKEGTLVPVEACGKKWLSAKQVEEFIKLHREPGRPWHKPSVKEMWKMSREGGKDQFKE
jgi:hypothetical protein